MDQNAPTGEGGAKAGILEAARTFLVQLWGTLLRVVQLLRLVSQLFRHAGLLESLMNSNLLHLTQCKPAFKLG